MDRAALRTSTASRPADRVRPGVGDTSSTPPGRSVRIAAVQSQLRGGADAAARVRWPAGDSRPRRPADPARAWSAGAGDLSRSRPFADDARMFRLALALFSVQAGFHAFTASLPV